MFSSVKSWLMFSPGFKHRQPGDFTGGPVALITKPNMSEGDLCDPPARGHCPVKGRGARSLTVAMGWEVGKLVPSGYSRPCRSAHSRNRVTKLSRKWNIVPGALFLDELLRGKTETLPVGMFPAIYLSEAKPALR